jgi:outer membrane protein TolC
MPKVAIVWILAAGAALGAGEPVLSGAPAALSLDAAVAAALANNPGLAAAGHARRGASEEVAEARSRFAPRVDLSETASRTDNPTMVFSNLLGQERFGPANFAIPSLNEPDPLTNFNTRLSLTQPVYAGGRIRAGLAASRHAERAARGVEERVRQVTVYRTVGAFHGVLLARRQREVAVAAREAAAAHLRAAEALVAAGLAVPAEVTRVKVRLAEIEEMLIRAEAGGRVARSALEAVMGEAPRGPYEPVEPSGGAAALPDLEAAVGEALRRRPDLNGAREEAGAASQGVRAAKGSRLPQAGLVAAYELNDEALLGSSGRNWTAMLSVSVNVFDGLGSASRVRRALAGEERAAALVEGFEAQVALEVRMAHAELAGALARGEAARSAAGEAEEAMQIARDRYENGLATLTDLLDQETALTSARARAAQADFDRRDAEAALLLAMGALEGPPKEATP